MIRLILSREEIKRMSDYSLRHSDCELFLISREPISGIGKGLTISSSKDDNPLRFKNTENITDYSKW